MKKAFTLIELIVVIAIIAILAAIIAPNAFKAIEKAKVSEAIADFKTYKTAIGALYADTGHWVGDNLVAGDTVVFSQALEGGSWHYDHDLIEDKNSYSGWDGPYLEREKPKTPWGGAYMVSVANPLHDFFGSCSHLVLEFESLCDGVGSSQACNVPKKAAERIDRTIDDDNLGDGMFQETIPGGTYPDYHWILFRDVAADSCP